MKIKMKKILGIRYGRVKLKGIPEKGNIYGFYSNELPIPKAPEIVVQRKRKIFYYLLQSVF